MCYPKTRKFTADNTENIRIPCQSLSQTASCSDMERSEDDFYIGD